MVIILSKQTGQVYIVEYKYSHKLFIQHKYVTIIMANPSFSNRNDKELFSFK